MLTSVASSIVVDFRYHKSCMLMLATRDFDVVPGSHRVRVVLGVLLDGSRCSTMEFLHVEPGLRRLPKPWHNGLDFFLLIILVPLDSREDRSLYLAAL